MRVFTAASTTLLTCMSLLLACKPPAQNNPTKVAKSGGTSADQGTAGSTSTATSSSTSVATAPVPCMDAMGVAMANQFTDPALNTTPPMADCYNASRTLVYTALQGQQALQTGQLSQTGAQTCYAQLSAQYGNQLIYPVQSMFPNLYMQATQQPAGMQETYLLQMLQSRPCSGFN